MLQKITVSTTIHKPVKTVWDLWTQPEHILRWNNASEDWHTVNATNDLTEGGAFLLRMEAKDGSAGFDFEGTYSHVVRHARIAYTMSDGRIASVQFQEKDGVTTVTETFDAEQENSIEMQQQGWQAILDNFKAYCESNAQS